ncbi:MAG: S-layer homology domain-containing protein [Clostridia bacterium]|nr:S-layer homology domain-containing protein [Clostridia bacterium]
MKKKINALIMAALLVAGTFPAIGSGAGEKLSVNYSIPSDNIDIYLTAAADSANVIIADDENANVTTTYFALIKELEKDANGNFSYAAAMPDDAGSGKYFVTVGFNGASLTDSFWYMSESQAAGALDALEGATAENFVSLIGTHHSDLGIDYSAFNTAAAEITNVYMKNKPQGELTKKKFLTAYSYAYLIGSTKGVQSLSAIEEVFKKEAAHIGFDMTAYNALDNTCREDVLRKFQSGAYTSGNPEKVIGEWICLAEVNNTANDSVENFDTLLFTTYNSVLLLDTTGYTSSNSGNIMLEVIGGRPYGDVAALKKAFSDAKIKYPASSGNLDSGDNDGGGFGGGGGGGGPSQVMLPATKEETGKFTDVPSTHWAYNQINTLCDKGIVSGKDANRFFPEDSITRAEFSKIIAQTFFKDARIAEISFSDVQKGAWYYEYVAKLSGLGIILGDEKGCFNPNARITRQDAAVIIGRMCEKKGISLLTYKNSADFADASYISSYAKDAVNKLCGAGIINGMADNTFKPLDNLTRAQGVQLVYVTMQKGQEG